MKVMPMLTPGKGQISWVCAQNEGQAKTHPAEFFPECRGGQGGKGKGKALPTWIPVSTRHPVQSTPHFTQGIEVLKFTMHTFG
eukprot:scaffold139145_cov15-Tisochrysis_lutea.AAC.1